MSNEKTKVLLDLDTGIDDALALAYALGSPEVELAGVVSSYGNLCYVPTGPLTNLATALAADAPRFLEEFSCRVRRALAGC